MSRNEWFLWTFEVANITLFVILLCIFHPGRYLPRSSKIFLDPIDGKTERMGPGFSKDDKRPLLVTFFDPFNFYGILTGKGMVFNKFWEEYQNGCVRENPNWPRMPALPITATKVAVFLEYETKREKASSLPALLF